MRISDWSSDVCSSDLAFTCAHFSDFAVMQRDGAQHLDVEMTHAKYTLAGLPHDSKGLGQKIVERRPVGNALTKFGGFCSQLVVGERLHARFKRVDLRHLFAKLFK